MSGRGHDAAPARAPDRERRSRRFLSVLLVVAGIVGALAVRWLLRDYESADYQLKLSRWWDFILENGRIAAHQHGFHDYSPPYVWLLSAATLLEPWIPKLYAIKSASILFDFLLAFFVYRCVRLKYAEPSRIPVIAGLATLFAPTIVMNSAMWAQADAVYTAFLAAALYCLIKDRTAWAVVCASVSFAIKPQAFFLAPLFFWLLLKRKIRWRELLLWPAIYLLSLLPNWWIGHPLDDLLDIYLRPTAVHRFLATDAPTLYAFVPTYLYDYLPLFLAAVTVVVLFIAEFLVRSRRKIGPDQIVLLAAFSALLVPWILPTMLGRFFFPAEALSIVLAFWFPRFWYVPVAAGLLSTPHYLYILQVTGPVPTTWLALGMFALVVALAVGVRREFAGPDPHRAETSSGSSGRTKRTGIGFGWLRSRWAPAVWLSVPAISILAAFVDHRVLHTDRERLWIENSGHLRDALLGRWDEPTVESRFDLYWLDDTLFYRKSPCSEADLEAPFFVHLDAIARAPRDSDLRDFESDDAFGLENGECLGRLPLPVTDGAAAITTGQRGPPGQPSLWEARVPLELSAHREAFDLLATGELGSPLARSDFDLYRKDGSLWYYRESCAAEDVEARFFVELHSSGDPSSGRRNLDFDFEERGVRENDRCIAIVLLGEEPAARVSTGQWSENHSWRVTVQLDEERWRRALRDHAAGDWGPPSVRSDFDLYLDGPELRYFKEPCSASAVEARFFLHVHGGDPPEGAEPRRFRNLDFGFGEHGVILDGKCLAIVPLPPGDFTRVATGQWRTGEPPFWSEDLWSAAAHRRFDSLADAAEEPESADAGFHLDYDGKALWYYRAPCAAPDLESQIFLHLYPNSPDDLPEERRDFGFENRDFAFSAHGFLRDSRCLARVPLPNYDLARLRTGQSLPDGSRLWTTELDPVPR